jgi:tetratricopeptide (TPR) repeat protein
MYRFFLLLTALTALSQCATEQALAQKGKRPTKDTPNAKTAESTPEAEYEKGNAAFDRKAWATATTHYNAALKLKADYVPALINRGRVSFFTGKFNDAVTDLSKACELKPDNGVAQTWLAAANLDKGDHAAALVAAGKAVKLDENQGLAWYVRGTAQIHKGEYKQAIDDLNEAAKLTPNDPVIYNNRGIAWEKLGDAAKAKADFDRRDQLKGQTTVAGDGTMSPTKQHAHEQMLAAKKRFDQIDFNIQSLQRRRPVVGQRVLPGQQVVIVPTVPQDLLKLREEAWKAFQEASRVYKNTP